VEDYEETVFGVSRKKFYSIVGIIIIIVAVIGIVGIITLSPDNAKNNVTGPSNKTITIVKTTIVPVNTIKVENVTVGVTTTMPNIKITSIIPTQTTIITVTTFVPIKTVLPTPIVTSDSRVRVVYYFSNQTCPNCIGMDELFDNLMLKYGSKFIFDKRDIDSWQTQFENDVIIYNNVNKKLPFVIINGRVFYTSTSIDASQIEALIVNN